ncbi:3754_t:CDS:2, partial [Racocetra persica]
ADGVDEIVFSKGHSKRTLPEFLSDVQDRITITLDDIVHTGNHEIITLTNGNKAILLPVTTSTGKSVLTSVMICGINPQRALDREYMGFLQ